MIGGVGISNAVADHDTYHETYRETTQRSHVTGLAVLFIGLEPSPWETIQTLFRRTRPRTDCMRVSAVELLVPRLAVLDETP